MYVPEYTPFFEPNNMTTGMLPNGQKRLFSKDHHPLFPGQVTTTPFSPANVSDDVNLSEFSTSTTSTPWLGLTDSELVPGRSFCGLVEAFLT